jgi:hypothetical protein
LLGVVLGVVLGACAATAKPTAAPAPAPGAPPAANAPTAAANAPTAVANAPTAADCEALRARGNEQIASGTPAAAVALLEPALATCGTGHGLHDVLGQALAAQHRLEDAAHHYITELRDPETAPATFGHLDAIYDQLSQASKLEIAALGAAETAPIKVPEIRFEYAWVGRFACAGGAGKVGLQSLVSTKTGQLDELTFECPDGKEHHAYFDFSDDPDTKALEDELKQQLKPQDKHP